MGEEECPYCGFEYREGEMLDCYSCNISVCSSCSDSYDCEDYCNDCFEQLKFSMGKY